MSTVSKRLAWKESTLLRTICISCVVLLAILLIAGLMVFRNSRDYTQFVGNMVICLGGIVGLAYGILMFVFERESGTDMFLESFPVNGGQVARTKLIQTVKYFAIYTVAAIAVGWAAIAIYDGGLPKLEGQSTPGVWLSMIVLIPTQCLLWTLLCSLFFKSSLPATIASAVLTVVSVITINIATSGWTSRLNDQMDLNLMVGSHLVACITLAVVVSSMSPMWLRGRKCNFRGQSQTLATKVAAKESTMRCAYSFRALFWQNIRRCWLPCLIVSVCLLVIGNFLGGVLQSSYLYFAGSSVYSSNYTCLAQGLFIVAGAWIGVLMFSGDQSNSNFLFFQQRADYPRRIWLSRLTILLAMTPVVFIAACLVAPSIPITWAMSNHPSFTQQSMVEWFLGMPRVPDLILIFFAAASMAQLATMTIRIGSGFLAFIVTSAFCVVVYAWQREIFLSNGSFLTFIGPIMLACFAATWWLAPRWISGRGTISGAVTVFTTCGLVAALTFGGWIWHRVTEYEVPHRSAEWTAFMDVQSLPPAEPKFAAAVAINDVMKKLQDFTDKDVKNFPDDLSKEQLQQYFATNEKVLNDISESLKDPNCGLFLNPRSSVERESQQKRLSLALKAATLHHLDSGNAKRALGSLIDELRSSWWVGANNIQCKEALTRLWQWASEDSCDDQLIRDAIKAVDDLEFAVFDPGSEVLYRESVLAIERMLGENGSSNISNGDYAWRIERSRRWNLSRLDTNDYWPLLCSPGNIGPPTALWQGNDNLYAPVPDSQTHACETSLEPHFFLGLARLRNQFRYTKIRLALVAWNRQHGSWPDSLDELCSGDEPLLKEMPVSFFSEREFVYSGKEGLDEFVFFTPENQTVNSVWQIHFDSRTQFEAPVASPSHRIGKGQPFLLPWSGVVGQKRPIQLGGKTKFAYWIPTGQAYPQELVENVRDYLLE